MHAVGWMQLAVFTVILFAITKPLGLYLVRVLDPQGRTYLEPVLKPVETLVYTLIGAERTREQEWKGYAASALVFGLTGALFTYVLLRFQQILPLNPQHFGALSPDLSFNTAASFSTNTNWQNYGGESTMSYWSQMVALTSHMFFSAAMGVAVAAALVRGIARQKTRLLGNFWVDLTRVCLYLLLPLSLVVAVFLVSQGVIQNFSRYAIVKVVEPYTGGKTAPAQEKIKTQTIAMGPVASQEAIKELGTNGGGFMNANSAHPYENPTPLSNFIEILAMFAIGSGMTYYLGRMVGNQKHGWSLWAAMLILFLAGAMICSWSESHGDPRWTSLGVSSRQGNMEGKEARFGAFDSALFSTVTTDTSCGAANSTLDSYLPLGGLVPLFNMHMGCVVFGGAGSGLYGMMIFVVLAIFLAGLMIGRTPEYLGKKLESYDVMTAVLAILFPSAILLGFTALACVSRWGLAARANFGPHGLTEILYAFTSCVNNNGSAFAGLNGNTLPYNTTLGLAMLVGRYFVMIPVLALAGNLANKKAVPVSSGSMPVSGATFILVILGTVLIVGALTFFPVVSLGPIVEHFLMANSTRLF